MMNKDSYPFLKKHSLEIIFLKATYGKGVAFTGIPQYPNGYLMGIIAGHTPMNYKYFRRLTLEEEVEVIKNILKYGKSHERYPLVDESGQICIYKEQAFVYDTTRNGSVIGEYDSFDDTNDEKDENPIMVLPSEDMLGILEDFIRWKEANPLR